MINLTNQNFNEILNQIEQCDNQADLPIIQIDLIRPTITFSLIVLLSMGMAGIFVLLSNIIKGNFHFVAVVFFVVWFFGLGLFITYEIKTYKIKAFWNKTKDEFYCQLTPTHLIYRFNENEIKITWQKVFEISYVRGNKNIVEHLLITPRSDFIRIYDYHTFLKIKPLVELFRVYHHKICPPNPKIAPVSLFGFKL